jgi:hypothetical protein
MSPIGSALLVFGGIVVLAKAGYGVFVSAVLGFAALVVQPIEAKIALVGLVVLQGASKRRMVDESSVGWGLVLLGIILKELWSGDIRLHFALTVLGVFLLGGFWPATGSWLAENECWGRRSARGILALVLMQSTVPLFYPVSFEGWAPLLVFLPGVGVLWAAALSLSEKGQQRSLVLFWFFELQLLAVFVLGSRYFGASRLHLLVWALLLPLGCLLAVTGVTERTDGRRWGRLLGLVAVASLLLLPGLIGFAAGFLAVFTLLASSPAGLVIFGIGFLAAPMLLRPVREELRRATPESAGLAAAAIAVLLMVALGLLPGLAKGEVSTQILWEYLLASM